MQSDTNLQAIPSNSHQELALVFDALSPDAGRTGSCNRVGAFTQLLQQGPQFIGRSARLEREDGNCNYRCGERRIGVTADISMDCLELACNGRFELFRDASVASILDELLAVLVRFPY
jgi:hypothetical protein